MYMKIIYLLNNLKIYNKLLKNNIMILKMIMLTFKEQCLEKCTHKKLEN